MILGAHIHFLLAFQAISSKRMDINFSLSFLLIIYSKVCLIPQKTFQKKSLKFAKMSIFTFLKTLFLNGGISRVTPQWTVRWSSNFMILFLSTFVMSHWGHFSKKNLKIWKIAKIFSNCSDIKGSPLWKKKFENCFLPIFVANHIFST